MKAREEKTPKISIIMTVKNSEKYLNESMNSIFKQTLDNIEVVCVYAESEDNTLKILKEIQGKDKRVKIYYQTEPGIGAAKNQGIENSTGEFITFLDSDDFYLETTALEKMYETSKEQNVKICGALRKVLNENGDIVNHPLHRAFLVGFPNGRHFSYLDLQYDYHFHSYIYDRKFIIESDARFANSKAYDDTHFFIRAMYNAQTFYVIPVELYCYRVHGSYAWDEKTSSEALSNLISQLEYTKNKQLQIAHYITVQRINYEYGPLFEKHVRAGSMKILRLLIDAQEKIDSDLLEQVMYRKPSADVFEPMNFPQGDLKKISNIDNDQIIITPLYNLLKNNENQKNYNQSYYEEINRIYNSKTYKAGKVVLWLPKKILRLLKIKKRR